MKRVAFIGQKGIPAEFTGTSGVEFYVEQKAKRLVRLGVSVTCYVRSWATPRAKKTYQGIQLIHIPTIKTKHFDAFVHSLLSSIHVCFTSVDTVWYQATGPAFFSLIPKLFGKKIFVTIHALDWKRDKWGWTARLLLRMAEHTVTHLTNTLFVVSEDLKTYFRTTYKKETTIDRVTFQPYKKITPDIIAKKYDVHGNDYILYLGRFVPEKRIEWLIEAYAKLQPKNVKLILAGGESNSKQYYAFLQKLTKNNTNILFTGYVFGKEKQELLTNCRLFVLPSAVEGDPIVIKELHNNTYVLMSNELKKTIRNKKHIFTFDTAEKQDFFKKLKAKIQ
ncbi:MAG: glycosyltransferase family 4 protein [Microgenomates group bacterium]